MMQPTCPAAIIEPGRTALIARCQVEGILREAHDSPCCGDYTMCPIWRQEKERYWVHKRPHVATEHMTTDGSLEWR